MSDLNYIQTMRDIIERSCPNAQGIEYVNALGDSAEQLDDSVEGVGIFLGEDFYVVAPVQDPEQPGLCVFQYTDPETLEVDVHKITFVEAVQRLARLDRQNG